jgi:N-acetylglucosaminyl-diphospho-decaprenol L-rhamnosyltransferase
LSAEVTVAVVSWNTRDVLERCLRSLEPYVRSGLADVWVVDNGSSDGSPELVRERFEWATLEEPGENLGYGRAVNVVAERSDTPWLAASNADVELEPRALERLLAVGRAPDAGAVAPRLILPDGSTQHSVYGFAGYPSLIAFNTGLYKVVPGLGDRLLIEGRWDPTRPRAVPWALGAFLLIRRDAFDAAGGFDPAQWLYAEDVDLGWRLGQAGWRVLYEPDARVHHAQGAAARQAFGEQPYERWMAATYDWIERRRGRPRRIVTAAVNLAGSLVRRDRAWARVHRRALSGGRDGRHAGPSTPRAPEA